MIKNIAIIGPHAEEYSLARVNREFAYNLYQVNLEKKLGLTIKLTAPAETVARIPSKSDIARNPYLNELYESYDQSKQWDLVIYNNFPKDAHSLHNLKRYNSELKAAYLAWEEDRFPQKWVDEYNRELDFVIAASEHTRYVLQRSGVQLPIILIPNALSDKFFQREIHPKTDKIAKTNKTFKFLHISSGMERKGAKELISAYCNQFSQVDDVCLVIKSFPGPNNMFSAAIQEFTESDDSPEIELIDDAELTDEEMAQLYDECDTYLSPSKAEGFNLPVLEAMHFGLPVVTTAWSGHMDFCNDDNALLVDYELVPAKSHLDNPGAFWAQPDIEDLQRKMRLVYESSGEKWLKQLKDNAKNTAKQYTWSNSASQLLNLLPELASLKSARDLKLGVVTTYNTICGIAEYSNYLYCNVSNAVADIKFLANKDASGRIQVDRDNVIRIWQYDEQDFSSLLQWIDDSSAENASPIFDIIHIQYSEGFYTLSALAQLIDGLSERGIKTVLTAHGLQVDGVDFAEIKPQLEKLEQIQALNQDDISYLRSIGLDNAVFITHGNVTLPLQSKMRLQKEVLDMENGETDTEKAPVIATHGFMSEGKGIMESLEAIKLIHQDYPQLKYLAVNAVNPRNMTSAGLSQHFQEKVKDYGLEKNVIHLDQFLDQEEIIIALATADICIFAYPEAKQTASGAVKLAMAAGRPIVTTNSFQMNDMRDIAHLIDDNKPESIAKALKSLLTDRDKYFQSLLACLNHREKNSWERVSLNYLHLLTNLSF
jgi:glycosyltransferase involved in cell wall biosynthesis